MAEIKPELLVLVESRREALRLIVTWERAWNEYGESRSFSGSVLRPEFRQEDPFTIAWSQLSDVDVEDIEQLTPVLFLNELLGPEGETPDWVVSFVRKMMIDAMT